jgi:hypothetical protein
MKPQVVLDRDLEREICRNLQLILLTLFGESFLSIIFSTS